MDIRAQAELRRKKILANAEARLKKITGKENVDISLVPEKPILSESSNGFAARNGSCNVREETDEKCVPNIENDDNPNLVDDINTRIGESIEDSPVSSRPSDSSKQDFNFKFYCFFYLSFGVVIRILILFGFSWVLLNNAIGAFVVACIPGLSRLYKTAAQSKGLLSLACLAGRHEGKLQIIIKIIYTFRMISQFLALYLFSFILTDCIVREKDSR